jgi:hypothetical protein
VQTVSGQRALDYVRIRHGIGTAPTSAVSKADRTIDGGNAGGKAGKSTSAAPSPTAAAVSGAGIGIGIAVYNGTTARGLAARGAAALTADGFTVTGTATASTQGHATTLIEYGPGLASQARTVAKAFPGAGIEPVTGSSTASYSVSVTPTPPTRVPRRPRRPCPPRSRTVPGPRTTTPAPT